MVYKKKICKTPLKTYIIKFDNLYKLIPYNLSNPIKLSNTILFDNIVIKIGIGFIINYEENRICTENIIDWIHSNKHVILLAMNLISNKKYIDICVYCYN